LTLNPYYFSWFTWIKWKSSIFNKGSSLVTLFIGWDGLGITSYFLVLYYNNWTRSNRALVTVLSNRVGDGLLLWTFLISIVKELPPYLTLIQFLFLLGISTKRAQLPFRAWLPLAMRAPTPIRALVHSSTLVTAGIYLRIKYFNLLFCKSLLFLYLIGSLTVLTSGVLALIETDGKSISFISYLFTSISFSWILKLCRLTSILLLFPLTILQSD